MSRRSLQLGLLVLMVAVVAWGFWTSPSARAAEEKAVATPDAKPAADCPAKKKPADPFGGTADPFDASTKPRAKTSAKAAAECRSRLTDLRAGEEVIEEELAKPVVFEFCETPLQDIVDYLRAKHKINIMLDQKALDNVGIGADMPLTCRLANVPLESALNLLLRQPELTWTIHEGILLITTPEEAETMMYAEVYDVADLVVCRDSKGELWDDYDILIDSIMTTVHPHSWDAVGGPGSIAGATHASAKVLVVSHTRDVHKQVAEVLKKIRSTMPKDAAKEPPLRERGYSGGFSGGGLGAAPPQSNPPQQPQDSPGMGSGTFK